jgi:hypothetical protein
MASQNLISAAITPDAKSKIVLGFTNLDAGLDFTIALKPEDKSGLVKAGDTFLPFIDIAYKVTQDFPQILPGVYDLPEFQKDYTFRTDLIPIRNKLMALAEAVDNTLFAVTSDCLAESLQVYAYVQQNQDKVPGLNTIAAEMAEFFKRSPRKITATTTATKTTA